MKRTGCIKSCGEDMNVLPRHCHLTYIKWQLHPIFPILCPMRGQNVRSRSDRLKISGRNAVGQCHAALVKMTCGRQDLTCGLVVEVDAGSPVAGSTHLSGDGRCPIGHTPRGASAAGGDALARYLAVADAHADEAGRGDGNTRQETRRNAVEHRVSGADRFDSQVGVVISASDRCCIRSGLLSLRS